MRLSLFAALLFVANGVLAQTNQLLPVRINHQWGFIDTSGELVRPPKYDYISDINLPWHGREHTRSGYFAVEAKGLVGLIDSNFSQILVPAWREIQPINPDLFLVASPDGGYTMTDKSGRDLLNATYEAIQLPEQNITHFFLVQRRGLWGVHRRGAGLAVPTEHGEIAFLDAGKGFFKTKKSQSDSPWLLTDWDNRALLETPQREIIGAGRHHLLTKEGKNSNWVIRTPDGAATDTLNRKITEFIPLNGHLLAYRDPVADTGISVYVFALHRTLYKNIDTIWTVDERLVVYKDDKKTGLIDSLGNLIPVENLSDLASGDGKIYRLRCTSGKWGLFSMEKGMFLPCTYDRIEPFAGKLAVCRLNFGTGVLNQNAEIIVPPVFERVRIEQNTIKGDLYNLLIQYHFDPKTGLLDAVPDTLIAPIRVRIGFTGRLFGKEDDSDAEEEVNDAESESPTETSAQSEEQRDTVPLFDEIKFDSFENDIIISADSQYIWRKAGGGFQLCVEIKKKSEGETPAKGKNKTPPKRRKKPLPKRYRPANPLTYSKMFKCRDVDWNIAVVEGEPLRGPKTIAGMVGIAQGFYQVAIFDNARKDFIPGLDIIGIRLRDFRKKQLQAIFLTPDGRMGFIGRDGKQVTDSIGAPLRFEYVGPMRDGKMRVCAQGKKSRSSVGKEKQPVAVTGEALCRMFNLQYRVDERRKTSISSLKIVSNENQPPLWGYLDERGKIAVAPVFEYASDFKDSAAACRKNGKWGVIDYRGATVVPYAYDAIKRYGKNWRTYLRNPDTLYFDLAGRYFADARNAKISGLSGGFFAKKDKESGKFGYMDINGAEVIPCRFDVAQDFSEGLAAVREAGKWAFIDTLGNVVAALDSLSASIIEIGSFREGLCWFRAGKAKAVGYLDRRGRVQIEPAFHGKAADFRQGLARVRVKRQPALIDTSGRFVAYPGRYGLIGDFNRSGLAEVRDTTGKLRGMINLAGDEVIPLRYSQILSSPGGHAVFDGAYWQYLGHDGKPLMPLQSKEPVKKLSAGLALVRDSSTSWSYRFVPNGEVFLKNLRRAEPFQNGYAEVVPAKYKVDSLMIVSEFGNFLAPKYGERFLKLAEGLIEVQRLTSAEKDAPKFYYANTNGQNPFHRGFASVEPFRGGVAIVKPKNRFGAFNSRGWMVVPPKYAAMKHHGNYLETNPLLQGFVSGDGKRVVEPAFDLVELLDNGLLRVEWGDKVGYLRQNGEWLWPRDGLLR